MEWIVADSEEEICLISDVTSLTEQLHGLKTGLLHSIYAFDTPQQFTEGVQRYAGADTLVPEPEWIGQKQMTIEEYQQRRAVEAMDCMAKGGFVLRIFNRS